MIIKFFVVFFVYLVIYNFFLQDTYDRAAFFLFCYIASVFIFLYQLNANKTTIKENIDMYYKIKNINGPL